MRQRPFLSALHSHTQIGYVQTVRWRTPPTGSTHKGTHQLFAFLFSPHYVPPDPVYPHVSRRALAPPPTLCMRHHDSRSDPMQAGTRAFVFALQKRAGKFPTESSGSQVSLLDVCLLCSWFTCPSACSLLHCSRLPVAIRTRTYGRARDGEEPDPPDRRHATA